MQTQDRLATVIRRTETKFNVIFFLCVAGLGGAICLLAIDTARIIAGG